MAHIHEIALITLRWLNRKLSLSRSLFMTPRQRLGRKAESYVAGVMKAKKYSILKRNFTARSGEIDLIAFRDGIIAFVEVRSRTGDGRPLPHESVDRQKQRRLIAAARTYISRHLKGEENFEFRFDVASVIFDPRGRICRMEYFEDAFRGD